MCSSSGILLIWQKLVPVNVDGAVIVPDGAKAVAVPKVAQKRVTVKPDPKAVIVISPDTVEEIKIQKPVKDGSSRKKAQTSLTSILTARSKVTSFISICLTIPFTKLRPFVTFHMHFV